MKYNLLKLVFCFSIFSIVQAMEENETGELNIQATQTYIENNESKNKDINLKILNDQLTLEQLQDYLKTKGITTSEKLCEYNYTSQENVVTAWTDPKFLGLIAKHLMTFDYNDYSNHKTNIDFWSSIENYYQK